MRFAPIHSVAAFQPIAQWAVPSTTQKHPLGTKFDAVDPFWGYGEFVYGKAANALNVGNLVTPGATFHNYDKTPNTANTGAPCLVAVNEFASGAFGWFQKAGICVVKSTATVAAATPVGLTGAGTIGANTAGKQILGYNQLASQTATKAISNVQTLNGSSVLVCPGGYDGFFLGAALSGTGIPGSTVVAQLDPDGKTVYMGSAVGTIDKLATATGTVTVTATFTGYSIGQIESPFVQGAIT